MILIHLLRLLLCLGCSPSRLQLRLLLLRLFRSTSFLVSLLSCINSCLISFLSRLLLLLLLLLLIHHLLLLGILGF